MDAQHQAYVWPDHLSIHIVLKKRERESDFERMANILKRRTKTASSSFILFYFHLYSTIVLFQFTAAVAAHSVLIRWFNTVNIFGGPKSETKYRTGWNCHCSDSIHSIISNGFSKPFFSLSQHYGAYFFQFFFFIRIFFKLIAYFNKKEGLKEKTQHTSKWKYTIVMCVW